MVWRTRRSKFHKSGDSMQKGIVREKPSLEQGVACWSWCRNPVHECIVWDTMEVSREESHKWMDKGS